MKSRLVLCAVCCLLEVASAQRSRMPPQPTMSPSSSLAGEDVFRRVGPKCTQRPAWANDGREFMVDTSTAYVVSPEIQFFCDGAFGGANYLAVWCDMRAGEGYTGIFGTRVTPDGAVLDSAGLAISCSAGGQNQWMPAVAFDGANYLVVWFSDAIYGARVSPQGVILDTVSILVRATDPGDPDLANDGQNSLVVWPDYRWNTADIYGARITPAGMVLDPSGIPISAVFTSDQTLPSVAFDGSEYLVVWEDGRNDSVDVYGARVTPGGVVLDTAGIPICTGHGDQLGPAVTAGDSGFLVVWVDKPCGGDIYGARLTPDGVVLDTAGFAISKAAGVQRYPTVAFDGADYFVAWSDGRRTSNEDIRATRVTPQGSVLDTAGLVVSDEDGTQMAPRVTAGPAGCLVAWHDNRTDINDVYAARVTSGGTVLDTLGIPLSWATATQRHTSVQSSSQGFLVAWEDGRPGKYSDIYAARVSLSGAVQDPSGIAVSTAGYSQTEPAVASIDSTYLIAWTDNRTRTYLDIYGARVTLQGTVLDPNGLAISVMAGNQKCPAVASDGVNFFVVWEDKRNGVEDIYGARVTPQGTVLDPTGFAVTTAADTQRYPVVVFDGENFLVVWEEERYQDSDIRGSRVTPQGVVLDTNGVLISHAYDHQGLPAAAHNGAIALVVWQDRRSSSNETYGARVTPQGTVLDPAGLVIDNTSSSEQSPAIAPCDSGFLVCWADRRDGYDDIYGAEVSQAGVAGPCFPIVDLDGSQQYPALAWCPHGEILLSYEGWASFYNCVPYNARRAWGCLAPFSVALDEGTVNHPWPSGQRTVVHGVLLLPPASGVSRGASSVLLDISGRKVLDLKPGPNDVSGLSPGVYFVREAQAARKVVLLR